MPRFRPVFNGIAVVGVSGDLDVVRVDMLVDAVIWQKITGRIQPPPSNDSSRATPVIRAVNPIIFITNYLTQAKPLSYRRRFIPNDVFLSIKNRPVLPVMAPFQRPVRWIKSIVVVSVNPFQLIGKDRCGFR